MGSWSLIAWQATFYQRVYELGPETYAPLLAVIIPIGGILGGVGGGLCGDWLSRIGGRQWLTAGTWTSNQGLGLHGSAILMRKYPDRELAEAEENWIFVLH